MVIDREHHPMLSSKSGHSYYMVMIVHLDVVVVVFDVGLVGRMVSPVLRKFGDYPFDVSFSVFVFHEAIPTVWTLRIKPRV